MNAEESLRDGDLQAALEALQAQVRADSSNASYRVFLFQLQCVMGQWDRALTQLNVAGDLDPGTLAMVQTYRELLQCEALRSAVFRGQRSPLVFGEPEEWIALVLEGLRVEADGEFAHAKELRNQAFEAATTSAGSLNDEPFEWIADADSRIGPILETIVNGRYYWIPFHRIAKIQCEEPEDLRDFVWTPAQFRWENGGETVGFIPTRYSGTELEADDLLRLARKTEWQELGEGTYTGLGQRIITTDSNEYSLLDIRTVLFSNASAAD